jgi:hypothetical protein
MDEVLLVNFLSFCFSSSASASCHSRVGARPLARPVAKALRFSFEFYAVVS